MNVEEMTQLLSLLKQFVRTAQIDKVDKAGVRDIISLIEVILGETENG